MIRNAFLGREAPLRDAVRRLSLPDGRLVTIAGRSGVGKTRLSYEVARRVAVTFSGGTALIDCSVPDVRPMADRVSAALGIRVAPGAFLKDALERRLRTTPVLLLADDVDTTDGALDALLDLIADAPAARILATAQRPTGHGEEHAIRLRPLPAPSPHATPDDIRAAPAVALYLARAAVANPGFVPTDDDLAAIGELCRRLDGLPLAIELGAARARVLSPASQVDALDRGDLLALRAPRGDRRPERHMDLRSVLEVTWTMTEPAEQVVLRRMAVFVTPPTLELLHRVASPPGWTTDELLDALGGLVDLGLVEAAEEPGVGTRYHLLPTIRALGLERLDAAGDRAQAVQAHEEAYLELARGTRRMCESGLAIVLAREAADLAIVLDRLDATGRIAEALELASDLVRMWARVGISAGVRARYDRLLAAAESEASGVAAPILARGLVGAAILAIGGSAVEPARERVGPWLERATALAREGRDDEALLFALEWAAVSIIVTGDAAWAVDANAEGLALAARLDDGVALTRFEYRAGMFAGLTGDLASVVAFGSSALRRARAMDDPESFVRTAQYLAWVPPETPGLPADLPTLEETGEVARRHALVFEEGTTYPLLAFARLLRGDLPGAAASSADGLRFATSHAAWHAATYSMVTLLLTASAFGDEVLVARIHGVLLPVMAEAIAGQLPHSRPMFLAAIGNARATLGEEAFAAEEATTVRLDRDASIDWAMGAARRLADPENAAAPSPTEPGDAAATLPAAGTPSAANTAIARLTKRERDVLQELARGVTNREIGATLGMTEKTVMHHSGSIYAKLGVRGRAEAAATAIRSGLVDDAPGR